MPTKLLELIVLAKDEMIRDIRKGLSALQAYIAPGGPLNLTDINVQAEDFVAGLLNAIHGWGLVNTNQATANYPCIDLIDEVNTLGVQVTSETSSAKVSGTLECIKARNLAGRVSHLMVFMIVPKQGHYTVRATCPGVTFEWQDDIIDFDDALKAIQAIFDLRHLERVHHYVIDSLPFVFPDQRLVQAALRAEEALEPPLSIPSTDPRVSRLAFSSQTTTLIGRGPEQSELLRFLNSHAKFSWWIMTGHAGTGKSRLALELCRSVTPGWKAGFLSRLMHPFQWSGYRPSRNSLIVIDYVSGRAKEVGEIVLALSRASASFQKPVRVLLVERELGFWWSTFCRDESHSERAEILGCLHGDALSLSGLSAEEILALAADVISSKNGIWNKAVARELVRNLLRIDPLGRPLFTMMVAEYMGELALGGAANVDLIGHVLDKEAGRRQALIIDKSELRKMDNLLLLATMTGGLTPKDGGFDHVARSNIAGLIPDLNLIDDSLYRDFAGSPSGGAGFAGLQPDILGERLFLDRLSATGVAGQTATRLLLAAWAFQPEDVSVAVIRACIDYRGEHRLGLLFDLPIDSPESRFHWADMVGDLMAVTGQSSDELAASQFRKLVSISEEHPQERRLQVSRARAEYNLGGILLFHEGNSSGAAAYYDAAIARAGERSSVGIMAIHNRGILRHQSGDLDGAFADYSVMIDHLGASEERRASALNNRADVFAERGDHENAIRDRTAVVALQDTTADRRYIALFRRSRSHFCQGEDQAGLADLDTILMTEDISPHQKTEARVERAACLRRLGRLQEAESDLDSVLDAEEYFPRTRAMGCVEMATLQRELKRPGQARMYLDYAEADENADCGTLIEALIVRGLLAEDVEDRSEAADLWNVVIAKPEASDWQKRFASDRLRSISAQ